MATAEKEHDGHRKQMRERVEKFGLDSLAPHEVLEYLLYITNPRKDTNSIAHALIERFGSLNAVLDASEAELLTVEGISPASARMLHLLPEVGRYYRDSRNDRVCYLRTTEQIVKLLRKKYTSMDFERALLIAIDAKQRLCGTFWLGSEGTAKNVRMEIKDIVSAALKGGTSDIVLCHNHPNGEALPSRDDFTATEKIVRALGVMKVTLNDHIILTDDDFFSMRDKKCLPYYDMRSGQVVSPMRTSGSVRQPVDEA